MTQEEKAKRYDEAINKVKDMLSYKEIRQEDMEYLFPELAEGEDEKIRKALKQGFFEYGNSFTTFGGIQVGKIIAWLEKQGDKIIDCPQNHQDVNHPNGAIVMEDFTGSEGFYKLHLDYLSKKQVKEVEEMVKMWNKESTISNENIKNCIGMCLTDASEQRFEDYDTTLKDCLDWLNNQSEQKVMDSSQVCKMKTLMTLDEAIEHCKEKSCDDTLCGKEHKQLAEWLTELKGYRVSANQETKKTADIAEPKFKVGDWIVFNGWVLHINEIVNGYYRTESIGGIPCSYDWAIDNIARLWTIADAKDGDVLVNGSYIFIFHFINKKRVIGYCHVNTNNGRFYDDIGRYECFCLIDGVVNPATKEQCDTLFTKMKEAGYVWDAENKKSRKIEPKTLNANKVIKWFEDMMHSSVGVIDKFKKDFGL